MATSTPDMSAVPRTYVDSRTNEVYDVSYFLEADTSGINYYLRAKLTPAEEVPEEPSLSRRFGSTPVNTRVASNADLSDQLKIVFRMPTDEEAVIGDVVQLIRPQPNYVEGHYYQYREVDGTNTWVDISNSIPYASQYGNGFYAFVGYRLFLVWADPPGVHGEYEWSRSEVYIRDVRPSGDSAGERRILISNEINAYAKDANAIHVTMGYDAESEFNPETQQLVLRTYFTNAGSNDTDYTESYITPFAIDNSSLLAFQSDWEETDPKSAGYIRNKPATPKKFEIDANGDLIYTYWWNEETYTLNLGHVRDVDGFFTKDKVVHINDGLEMGTEDNIDENDTGSHSVQRGVLAEITSADCDGDGDGLAITEMTVGLAGSGDVDLSQKFRSDATVTIYLPETGKRIVDTGWITDITGANELCIEIFPSTRAALTAAIKEIADDIEGDSAFGWDSKIPGIEICIAPGIGVDHSVKEPYGWNGDAPALSDTFKMAMLGMAVGKGAYAHGNMSVARGNDVIVTADLAAAIGVGLYNNQAGTCVVGAWNEILDPISDTSVTALYPFRVGIGTAGNRLDGFRVVSDGTVYIQKIFSDVHLMSPYASHHVVVERLNASLKSLGAVDPNEIKYDEVPSSSVNGVVVGEVTTDDVLPNGETSVNTRDIAVATSSYQAGIYVSEDGVNFRHSSDTKGSRSRPAIYVPEWKMFIITAAPQNSRVMPLSYSFDGIEWKTIQRGDYRFPGAVYRLNNFNDGEPFLMAGPNIYLYNKGTDTWTTIVGKREDGTAMSGDTRHLPAAIDTPTGVKFVCTQPGASPDVTNVVHPLYYSNGEVEVDEDNKPYIVWSKCSYIHPNPKNGGTIEETTNCDKKRRAGDVSVIHDINGTPIFVAPVELQNNINVDGNSGCYLLWSMDGVMWKMMAGLDRGIYASPYEVSNGVIIVPSAEGTGIWYTESLEIHSSGDAVVEWKNVTGIATGNWQRPVKLALDSKTVYVAMMDRNSHTANDRPVIYDANKLIVSEDGINWYWTDLVISAREPAVFKNRVVFSMTEGPDRICSFSMTEFEDIVDRALSLAKDESRVVVDYFNTSDKTKTWEDLAMAYNKLADAHNKLARSV